MEFVPLLKTSKVTLYLQPLWKVIRPFPFLKILLLNLNLDYKNSNTNKQCHQSQVFSCLNYIS